MKKLIDILKEKKYETDKWTDHYYVQHIYEDLFAQFNHKKINFLEIGVFNGESMKLWHDYFVNAKNIVGIDIFTRTTIEEVSKNLKGYDVDLHKINSKDDINKIREFSKKYKDGFDIIIDDGSHWYRSQIDTYKNFKNMMNPGGVYIIEDISFDDEESMYDSFELSQNGKGMEYFTRSVIQKEIPEINFNMSGGEKFQNQPVGIIYF